MIYLKSLAMGLVGAVVGVIAYALLAVLFVVITLAWQARAGSAGSGGIGAVSGGLGFPLIAAVLGFAAGFVWQLRRRTKARRASGA